MSEDNQQSVIANAGAIIQRFGGIRPMSKATGIPVTTIQGWKKRDIIPVTRREEIRRYAEDKGIAIDDLLDAPAETVPVSEERDSQNPGEDGSDKTLDPGQAGVVKNSGEARDNAGHAGKQSGKQHRAGSPRVPKGGGAQSAFMGQMAMIGVIILVAVLALATVMFWPDLKKVPEQNERIAKLERNVEEVDREVDKVSDKQDYLDALVPDDLKNQLSELHGKTRELSEKTGRLSQQMANMTAEDVQSYAQDAVSQENIRKLRSRVTKLEQKMRQYADDAGLGRISSFMTRLNVMQKAESGRKQLSQATSQLYNIVRNTSGNTGQLKQALMLRKGKNDALGKTLKGIESHNLKAAAMLMAFSNLRGALSRDRNAFKQDLSLMKKLVGDDNKELNKAINRLAPEAKDGVLTPSGLSREFRSLAGEIVAASLQGKDVSITEKARARMSEILTVKKDGKNVTGTREQKLVDKARTKLDKGNVEGAIQTLRQLDGRAAKKARPFIDKAQATALANQVKQMLSRKVMQQLGNGTSVPAPVGVSQDVPRYDPGKDMKFRPEQVQPQQGQ
jgi:hypothetical protein